MSLIGREINDFSVKAFVDGEFKDITKQDLLGKWSVIVFTLLILRLYAQQS